MRYTYKAYAFQGWRVAVARKSDSIVLYFSDRKHGGEKEALEAAKACKAQILQAIEDCETREDIRAAFAAIKSQYKTKES